MLAFHLSFLHSKGFLGAMRVLSALLFLSFIVAFAVLLYVFSFQFSYSVLLFGVLTVVFGVVHEVCANRLEGNKK
jgi:hypothetical protein